MDKKPLTFAEQFKSLADTKRRKNEQAQAKRRGVVDLKKVRADLKEAQGPKKFWG